MFNKISMLIAKANSTAYEAEKDSCLSLAKKLCTKHGYDFYILSGIEQDKRCANYQSCIHRDIACTVCKNFDMYEASSSAKDNFRKGFRDSCDRPNPEFWDFGEAYEETKKGRTIKDLYNFKKAFYYSRNGNLTFFEDDIRITFMEDDYGFTMCIDGVWFNDIDNIHACYAMAYVEYRNKTK